MNVKILLTLALLSVISQTQAQVSPSIPAPTVKDMRTLREILCPSVKRQVSVEEMQTFPTGKLIDGWATSLRGEHDLQFGQPMPMRFVRINMTDKKMSYSVYDGYGLYYLRVKDAEGRKISMTLTGEESLGYKMGGFTQILQMKPGEGHEYTFDLNKFYDFKKGGDYTVEAFQIIVKPDATDPKKFNDIELLSNTLHISVH